MKRELLLTVLIAAGLFILTMVIGVMQDRETQTSGPANLRSTLILDAGHGGEDGGAVSVTGAAESQINLQIVLRLRDLLIFCGTEPVLLREEDISLHDPDAVSLREKKVSDLHNRVETVQGIGSAVLLSIHQNSYTDGRYRGTQVFYAPTAGSDELAARMQEAVRTALQPDNTRECKKIPDTVYLMNHVDCPAVLVECGFLTNVEEEQLLRDAGYQKQLSTVLTGVWQTVQAEQVQAG